MITTEEAERIDREFTDAFEREDASPRQAAEELYRELGDEYNALGNQERADFLWYGR